MEKRKPGWYIDAASAVEDNKTYNVEHLKEPHFKLMEDAIAYIKEHLFETAWLFFRLRFVQRDGTNTVTDWRMKGDW